MPAPNSFLPFYNYHKSIDGQNFLFNFTVSLNCVPTQLPVKAVSEFQHNAQYLSAEIPKNLFPKNLLWSSGPY